MKYELFEKIMTNVLDSVKREDVAYHTGIDLTEVNTGYRNAIDHLLENEFGEGKLDLINWWLSDEEKILRFSSSLISEAGKESLDLSTIEKLWNYITK